MANKNVFGSIQSIAPATTTVNAAGGVAYDLSAKQAIAQIACTNTFNGTYYTNAEDNLKLVKESVAKLRSEPEFIAKIAVYSRNRSYMKDMPAYLCAVLAAWGESKLFRKVFRIVINDAKMLRNFIQIGRSGQAGKVINMSSGSVRHAINEYFRSKSSDFIFRGSIGNEPSMRDILRMARPKPENHEKAALYAYLKGAELEMQEGRLFHGNRLFFNELDYVVKDKQGKTIRRNPWKNLPDIVKQYENFKLSHEGPIPNVDFRMLDSVLTKEELKQLWNKQAETGSWQMTRMNLNNFQKYNCFDSADLISKVANRLKDREAIKKAKVYPYQLFTAFRNTESVPHEIKEALQDAMEVAVDNVPELAGKTYLCVDTSGSMSYPITGNRVGATSKVRCIDVAALFAAAVLRKNKSAEVVPFDTTVHHANLNGRDTVMTNANTLASFGGGGTDCSCALRHLNEKGATGNTVIFISDNESWVTNGVSDGSFFAYSARLRGQTNPTGLMEQWKIYKKRNPKAKLVCIDITPKANSQACSDKDILQIGGWSDSVFDVVASFVKEESTKEYWVKEIEKVDLPDKIFHPNTIIETEE